MIANVSWIDEQAAPPDLYLGPARVRSRDGRSVEVTLPDGEVVVATMALAYPYEPAVGDMLLVIAHGGGRYVIGVIEGSGKLDLGFQGDVDLHAHGGTLTLSADRGVHLRGPEVELFADRFSVLATSAVQKFTTLHQRVRELFHLHAGESHAVVDETALQRAKKVAIVAEETASVNGKQILLG